MAAVFGITLGVKLEPTEASRFLTAYVVEQALSVDNLFVFMLVFGELAVPARREEAGAGVRRPRRACLRVAMLAAGGAFLAHFHAVGWLLGALLVAMGIRAGLKIWRGEEETPDGEEPRTKNERRRASSAASSRSTTSSTATLHHRGRRAQTRDAAPPSPS